MKKICIHSFQKEDQIRILSFFKKVFSENNRILDTTLKDADLLDVYSHYCLNNGFFWCLTADEKIIGTIGLRKLEDCYEIRRFFILKKYQNKGYGNKLLLKTLHYAFYHQLSSLRMATLKDGLVIRHLAEKYGFVMTQKYNNSSADLFWFLKITDEAVFKYSLDELNRHLKSHLVLNPTENFPNYETYNTHLLEGLYVSERHKQQEDIVIFGGRSEAIDLYNIIKTIWKRALHAEAVDIKTHSGLNAHLILFLCLAKRGDKVLLLPEEAGGHFSTETMLKRIGMQILHFAVDNVNLCIDVPKTEKLIRDEQPNFIFVDRSEGLIYEDFSWVSKYTNAIKIFDASQYLSQIISGYYPNPLENGFDYLLSSLHKNYPGPQKSIIATAKENKQWYEFMQDTKTFISNTHPEAIFKSVIPLIDQQKFNEYAKKSIDYCLKLELALQHAGLPVVQRMKDKLPTPHIWILPKTQEKTYALFSKLEEVGINVNYRKLPYQLGFGLRLGLHAAIMQGLKEKHLDKLASIIKEINESEEISPSLKNKTQRFLHSFIAK